MIELVPLPFCIISIADGCELVEVDFIVKALDATAVEPAIPSEPATVAPVLSNFKSSVDPVCEVVL